VPSTDGNMKRMRTGDVFTKTPITIVSAELGG
jgi:hypothetical protein